MIIKSINTSDKMVTMEKILGVIEDIIEKFEQGSKEEREDALAELRLNIDNFKQNLQPLVVNGNDEANTLLERLKTIKL